MAAFSGTTFELRRPRDPFGAYDADMPGPLEAVLTNPWPAAVLLAVLAAVGQVAGARGGNRNLLRVGVGLLAAAAAVVALAYAVETDAEAVDRRSRSLVAATAPLDTVAFADHLADDARLLGPDRAVWLRGAELFERLESVTGRASLDQRVTALDVEPPDPQMPNERTVLLDLRTRAAGTPLLSSWRLTWRRASTGGDTEWELLAAQWLRFNQRPPTRETLR